MDKPARYALLSLLLLVPVPSLAVWVGMIQWPDTVFGQAFFAFGKIWILILPLLWLRFVEREPIRLSLPQREGLGFGIVSGLAISVFIIAAFWVFGRSQIDPQVLHDLLARVGLDSPAKYIAMAAYWCLVNSLLEEYVWRWFVTRQFRKLLPAVAAIIASAIGFTLHHILATQLYFPPVIVWLAALGVFTGGVIWSWSYLRFGSIWPAYISHALVDIAIFGIGYWLLY